MNNGLSWSEQKTFGKLFFIDSNISSTFSLSAGNSRGLDTSPFFPSPIRSLTFFEILMYYSNCCLEDKHALPPARHELIPVLPQRSAPIRMRNYVFCGYFYFYIHVIFLEYIVILVSGYRYAINSFYF